MNSKATPRRGKRTLPRIVGPDPLAAFTPIKGIDPAMRLLYSAFLSYIQDAGGDVTNIHGVSFVRPAQLVTGKGGLAAWVCCITASGLEPKFVRDQRRPNTPGVGRRDSGSDVPHHPLVGKD